MQLYPILVLSIGHRSQSFKAGVEVCVTETKGAGAAYSLHPQVWMVIYLSLDSM